MNKRIFVLFIYLMASLVFLTSCNSQNTQIASEDDPPLVTSIVTIQPTETALPTPSATLTADPNPCVIWAETPFLGITEEAKDLIRIRLHEKGIECRIEFVSSEDKLGSEYKAWLDQKNQGNHAPDIISAGLWERGVFDVADFVEKQMLPLDDYLLTEEGLSLYESYAKVEWDRTEVHGKHYTVPLRLSNLNEVYLYVNNQYKDMFNSTFDGTYESVRNLCSSLPSSPVIATAFGTKVLYAFMDCADSFGVSFDLKTWKYRDLTKQDGMRDYLQMIYSDFLSGLLVRCETVDDLPANALAFISIEKLDHLDGYTENIWNRDLCLAAPGLSYGVSASSQSQELALRVLSICYSDPELASLLCWRAPNEKQWAERTEYLESCADTSLAGFLPEVSDQQYDALQNYASDISTLCMKMFVLRDGVWEVNEHYYEYLDLFFSNLKEYNDMSGVRVFDILNKRFAEWREGQ